MSAAVAATAPAGRTVLVGIGRATRPRPAFGVVSGEREIIGSLSHVIDEDFSAAMALLAARSVRREPLVTEVSLGDALEGGLRAVA